MVLTALLLLSPSRPADKNLAVGDGSRPERGGHSTVDGVSHHAMSVVPGELPLGNGNRYLRPAEPVTIRTEEPHLVSTVKLRNAAEDMCLSARCRLRPIRARFSKCGISFQGCQIGC